MDGVTIVVGGAVLLQGLQTIQMFLVRRDVRDVRQSLSELDADLAFRAGRLTVERTQARLGGGTLEAHGSARLAGRELRDVDLRLAGRGFTLPYPEGLRAQLDADLMLTGQSGALLLGGAVLVQGGLYDKNLATEETFFAALPPPLVSPALRAVRLDLDITTDQPIRVRNDADDHQTAVIGVVGGELAVNLGPAVNAVRADGGIVAIRAAIPAVPE